MAGNTATERWCIHSAHRQKNTILTMLCPGKTRQKPSLENTKEEEPCVSVHLLSSATRYYPELRAGFYILDVSKQTASLSDIYGSLSPRAAFRWFLYLGSASTRWAVGAETGWQVAAQCLITKG